MLKVFCILAVFLHKYAGHAEPKFYLVKTPAETDSQDKKSEDFMHEPGCNQFTPFKPFKPRKYNGHTETEPFKPFKPFQPFKGHTEARPGTARQVSQHAGLYHIETKYLNNFHCIGPEAVSVYYPQWPSVRLCLYLCHPRKPTSRCHGDFRSKGLTLILAGHQFLLC